MSRVSNDNVPFIPSDSLRKPAPLPSKDSMRILISFFQEQMIKSQETNSALLEPKEIKTLSIGDDSLKMFYQGNSQMAICGWVIAVFLLAALAQAAKAMAGKAITAPEPPLFRSIDPSKMNLHQLIAERSKIV